MSSVEAIRQGIRVWLKTALGLTDDQIIIADDKGTRPPLPYLTVKVTSPGLQVGTHEILNGIDGGSGAPTVSARHEKRATVSLQAFGEGAFAWLEDALDGLPLPTALDTLDAAGLSVQPISDIRDVARFLDTDTEPRYAVDLAVDYRVETDPVSLVEAVLVGVDFDLDHGVGDPDALNIAEDIAI